jgi:hypothetical protein
MFTYVSCFLIVYYSYSLVKFVNLLMMWIAEQAPVVAILKLKPKVLDRQTCPQIWFRLYTKKYFAAIIILEDNLFSTDKDRKKCNFIEIRQENQWPMHILPNTTSICASVTKETYQPQHKIITTDPCAGIFLRKKNSMLVKKIFYSPQCPRIRFWSLNSPVLSHEFIGLMDFFIHLMCGKKYLHTDHEKKILSS